MRWAFSDESRRGGVYVVAAVVVETTEVAAVRAEVKAFLRSNQRRVHMTHESRARRNQFLALVERVVDTTHVVAAPIAGSPLAQVRDRAIRAMAAALLEDGVSSWHIEQMVPTIERRDRLAIADVLRRDPEGRKCVYDHRPAHDEPLLWAADAVAWASSRQPLPWARVTNLP